jgi:pSer/pThr/pTyr-binding forkhead associated (FHA) protein
MKTVTLYIESYDSTKTVALNEEISIGRTDAAQIVLGDGGLSRLNTTFFRDEDLIFVVDENSTNGTFVNDERIAGQPRQIFNGDRIKIGSDTQIRVEIGQPSPTAENNQPQPANAVQRTASAAPKPNPKNQKPNPKSDAPPMILLAAVGSMFLIVFLGIAAYVIVSRYETIASNSKGKAVAKISASAAIPIRVVDPLGGGEIEDLDELIEAWEVQDAAFEAKDLQAVSVSIDAPQLTVSIADWEKQRAKAMERRNAPTGLVSGVSIPPELQGNIGKQLAQFQKMGITRATLPKDFISLAQKRMNNELVELPLATEIFYLDNIGTSADASPFNVLDINTNGRSPVAPGSEDFSILQRLAANYNGQKYDLTNPSHRIQMKRRLLRMFHPDAKLVLEEIAGAYHKQFKRPLKITSLTRSLEYQIDLSRATSNAYRGQTPPHSTGRTFDIAYMHMTAEEQNFIMAKFAELERANRVDALHERGQTPCIHTFVFPK